MTLVARSRLLVLASSAVASTGGAAIKLSGLSALQVAGLRAGLAALVLAVLLRPPRGSWGRATLGVGVAQGLMMIAFVTSNKLTTAAGAIYLQATAPLYVLALSPLLLHERIERRDLAYLAIFAMGLLAVFAEPGSAQATAPSPFLGNVVAAFAGFGWALTILGLRWLASRTPRTGSTQSDPAGAAAVFANVFVFTVTQPWLWPLPMSAIASDAATLAWLGVVQVGLAYAFLTRGVRHLPALEVSLLLLVEPALAPVWAWMLHGEVPGAWTLAGGVIIVLATGARSLRRA